MIATRFRMCCPLECLPAHDHASVLKAEHQRCAALADFRCAACAFWTSSEPRGYGPVKTADPNVSVAFCACMPPPTEARVLVAYIEATPLSTALGHPVLLLPTNPQRIDCVPNDGKVVKDIITGKEVLSTKAQPIGRNGCYMRRPYMQYCLQVRAGQCLVAGLASKSTFHPVSFAVFGPQSPVTPYCLCSALTMGANVWL